MKEPTNNAVYQDRSRILVAIGALLLLIGIAVALLGPVEMYCFYLFSEGGRFHYEGFGFGSLMFGNIASQIVGYYLIALVLIPVGYGHLKVRRWARPLALTLVGFWLVVGVPLIVVFSFVAVASKDLSLAVVLIMLVALALSYLVLPGVLIWFYRSRNVKLTFEAKDPQTYGVERFPIPVLVLCSLYLFYIVVLHILILFNGIFPLFGVWLVDLQGILLLDILIACLACLIWGTFRLRTWAWWGSLIYFGLLTSSSILTLCRSSLSDILSRMKFAPTETEALQGLPFQGWHLAAFIGIPLLLTLGLIIFSKRYFRTGGRL
jgi:hypothetical protein